MELFLTTLLILVFITIVGVPFALIALILKFLASVIEAICNIGKKQVIGIPEHTDDD